MHPCHFNLGKILAATTIAGIGLVLAPAIVRAQASQAEMKAFPMPPTQGYAVNKAFSYVGDYGYFLPLLR